jgi:hypothetical protein
MSFLSCSSSFSLWHHLQLEWWHGVLIFSQQFSSVTCAIISDYFVLICSPYTFSMSVFGSENGILVSLRFRLLVPNPFFRFREQCSDWNVDNGRACRRYGDLRITSNCNGESISEGNRLLRLIQNAICWRLIWLGFPPWFDSCWKMLRTFSRWFDLISRLVSSMRCFCALNSWKLSAL